MLYNCGQKKEVEGLQGKSKMSVSVPPLITFHSTWYELDGEKELCASRQQGHCVLGEFHSALLHIPPLLSPAAAAATAAHMFSP